MQDRSWFIKVLYLLISVVFSVVSTVFTFALVRGKGDINTRWNSIKFSLFSEPPPAADGWKVCEVLGSANGYVSLQLCSTSGWVVNTFSDQMALSAPPPETECAMLGKAEFWCGSDAYPLLHIQEVIRQPGVAVQDDAGSLKDEKLFSQPEVPVSMDKSCAWLISKGAAGCAGGELAGVLVIASGLMLLGAAYFLMRRS